MDISQFITTFFLEADEKLAELEQGLLELDPGVEPDPDLINDIFRAAHTIKGGAGSFGFMAISDFTHGLETLLDEVRGGERRVTAELIEVLLDGKDCLVELVDAAKKEQQADSDTLEATRRRLQAMLEGDAPAGVGPTAAEPASDKPAQLEPSAAVAESSAGWQIRFAPHRNMMHSGNDPLRIIKELDELGPLQVLADLSGLPGWESLQPDDCYCAWTLILNGEVTRAQIEDVFLWVEDECELEIVPLAGVSSTELEPASVADEPAPVESDPRRAGSAAVTVADTVSGDVIVERRKNSDRRKEAGRRKSDKAEQTSIRVDIGKIDNVINQVGELITTQSILSNLRDRFDPDNPALLREFGDHLCEAVDLLERHTRDLQEHVMSMRMLPISFVFSRFGRTVHDLCHKLGKQVELHLVGEHTELDKTVVEQIGDPLMHLIRNSMDHGFETPAEREAAGKPATGVLLLNAYHKGGNVFIEVCDDGRGLDRQRLIAKALEKQLLSVEDAATLSDEAAYQLIMHPGFSTAEVISDVSGRGVGMDVVRQNIEALHGDILIRSDQGIGTTITIRLPLTLAIMDGQLISVGQDTFVVPVVSIVESLQVEPRMIRKVAGKGELLSYRDDYLPILRLHRAFGLHTETEALEQGVVVVLDVDGKRLAVFVDSIFGQQQVAIKSLESNFQRVDGVMGATILGDGRIALILDPPSLSRMNSVSLH